MQPLPQLHRRPGDADPNRRLGRQAFVGVCALAVLLHAALLGAAGGLAVGAAGDAVRNAPMAIRTVAAPMPASTVTPTAPEPAVLFGPGEAFQLARLSRGPPGNDGEAEAHSAIPRKVAAFASTRAPDAASPEPGAAVGLGAAGTRTPPSVTSPGSAEPEPAAAAAPASAGLGSLLEPGEQPPPTYRTALPAPATLHYEVRRGLLRGDGDIRWQPSGERYELRLSAGLAGITLLAQTSQGEIDVNGLAPTRFVDQRARRTAQAANFRRDSGTITFSGPSTAWPLLPGSQDRLSWMIQLAGIVRAAPELASEGATISMVLVGARGEASVRTLRLVGREMAETASGSVAALKFVVAARSAYDTHYEIWLDPLRDYLPVRAAARNGAGDAEFELLLQRIER